MTSQAAPRHPAIPLQPLLGVREGDDPVLWGRIRAAQLLAGRRFAVMLLVTNLLAAATVAIFFSGRVPGSWLLAWGVALGVISTAVSFRRLRPGLPAEGHAPLNELRSTAAEGLSLALIWSIPAAVFGRYTDPVVMLDLWMVLSILMTLAAVALASLTLLTITFIAGLALTLMPALLVHAMFVPAAITLLFATLLILACITRARALVQLHRSEFTITERDETVSLLLGEFEESSSDWLWETDAQRRLCKVTPRFAHALGRQADELDGQSLLQVLAGPLWEGGDFPAGLRMLSDKLKRRRNFRDLPLPVIVGNQQRWWEISASPRHDESGRFLGFRGVGSDVTERRASADKIRRMARYDTLTGLPNRLLVNETLEAALATADKWGSRAGFMMIDLDRFKAVNDTLGHPIGDRLLGRVAERLAQLITENELIGRLGGDEFAVVITDARDNSKVEALAQTIIDTLSQPYEVDQHTLYIGASVGMAMSPRDGRTAETLVRSADLALYRSKEAGGGVFHAYEPALHVAAEERRLLEMALRKALENGEMQLDYQPVVDARSEHLQGFEALLRWRSAEFGQVSPAKFIPLAEETRLIGPIGEWVVRTACAEAARWPGETRIAVNVSPEQLLNPNFVTVVAQALASSGLPSHRLELEVTESVFMKEGTGAVRVLERILDLGVRLSLDDFGTGYSSLGYLSRTRFSTIKIDRSFVQGASKGVPEAVAIIRAVVALADSLGMSTTAEGVETSDELAMIRELGCSKIQGYYYGRPLPVDEARDLAIRRLPHVCVA